MQRIYLYADNAGGYHMTDEKTVINNINEAAGANYYDDVTTWGDWLDCADDTQDYSDEWADELKLIAIYDPIDGQIDLYLGDYAYSDQGDDNYFRGLVVSRDHLEELIDEAIEDREDLINRGADPYRNHDIEIRRRKPESAGYWPHCHISRDLIGSTLSYA